MRQTGRNSSMSQDLYLSGFEVYGRLLNSLKTIKIAPPEPKKAKGGIGHKPRGRGSSDPPRFLPDL